jgi:mRNA-degrading endonuclease toxin of MazEF toxin-antitoxin module
VREKVPKPKVVAAHLLISCQAHFPRDRKMLKERLFKRIGVVSDEDLRKVEEAIKTHLDLF